MHKPDSRIIRHTELCSHPCIAQAARQSTIPECRSRRRPPRHGRICHTQTRFSPHTPVPSSCKHRHRGISNQGRPDGPATCGDTTYPVHECSQSQEILTLHRNTGNTHPPVLASDSMVHWATFYTLLLRRPYGASHPSCHPRTLEQCPSVRYNHTTRSPTYLMCCNLERRKRPSGSPLHSLVRDTSLLTRKGKSGRSRAC